MFIIGNKSYINIKLNNIIDHYDKNIRCNFGLSNHNNGTKEYIQYFNVHVYDNYMKYNLEIYINDDNREYLLNFINIFDKKKYIKILRQNNSYSNIYNNYLKHINCPYKFTKIPRLGCNAIFDTLLNLNKENYEKIYISHFSLSMEKNHIYNKNNVISDCHNINDEINIIIWLHKNNIIDITLCSLIDTILPTLDCKLVKPSIDIVYLLLKEYGICILNNYFNEESLNYFEKEYDTIFENHEKNIETSEKEDCSNDERIFHSEKYGEFIKKYFYDDVLFNEIAKKYNKQLNKKTLINKLEYEEGIIKNSGAGWHRDNHHCQFKAIMYLSDVSIDNGNFQFITNSNSKKIGFPKPRTPNYDTRYHDDTIKKILTENNNVNLHNIIGNRGTIILADTTYIHRGNIIKSGSRKAITQYFF